jgi:protease IV
MEKPLMSKPSLLRRFFGGLWAAITWVRVALANLLFLLIIALVYLAFVNEGPEPLPERAALLLNPMGTIVDQKAYIEPLQALLAEPNPTDNEVLLRDILDAVRYAADDPAITALVMELDYLMYAGVSKSQEIAEAVSVFKASGKPVIALGDYFTQDQYLLASQADTVIMHPFGGVAIEGFASYRNYFREALANALVTMHVFKAGEHKSMAEPFLLDGMSDGEKAITGRWLDIMWGQYTAIVEQRRELPAGSLDDYANNYAVRLQAARGDTAALALEADLVDQLAQRSEANAQVADMVGAINEDGLYEAVEFQQYVARNRALSLPMAGQKRVAVVTASGDIMPGEQPPGTVGGDTLAELITTTAMAADVGAIVLRVDSGGGSVFASEIIRQAVLDAKAQGLPVVVSMGSVAASGGYYIAAEADQIWATPATITGSIGVFAAFPTFEQLLEKFGIRTDGVGTTGLAGSLRVDRPLNPALASSITSSVEHTYRGFVDLVAQGRGMSFEQVDAVAQGRVWNATDALEAGLVDALGGLNQAIEASAELAGLDDYHIDFVEPTLSPTEQVVQQLADRVGSLGVIREAAVARSLERLLQPVRQAVAAATSFDDPRYLFMRCMDCGVMP